MFNYEHLALLGTYYPINFKLDNAADIVTKSDEKFEYVRYNPRKNINRWGLSLTSLDGGMSGIPDLDSLREYNTENNTLYDEVDFNVPTLAYEDFKEALDPFAPWLFRTHVLKLNSGGYFPPHRDLNGLRSFRLIVPLKNCKAPDVNFILEDKILNFEEGIMYFVDTVKMHYIFNASLDPSYWLILNVESTEEAIEKVFLNLMQT
jgi:hypothetical protein